MCLGRMSYVNKNNIFIFCVFYLISVIFLQEITSYHESCDKMINKIQSQTKHSFSIPSEITGYCFMTIGC